jgi:hypothetical protein
MAAADIHVAVVSPEDAYNGNAELWCGDELMAMTILDEGQLRLRIEARADGSPWVVDTTSLALGLAEAVRRLAAY